MDRDKYANQATLKRANLIEEVVQEAGFRLESKGEVLVCPAAPGLVVDPVQQQYIWPEHDERGDVIDWVKNRFGWKFVPARDFLRARAALPPERRPKIIIPKQLSEEPDTHDPVEITDRLAGLNWGDGRLKRVHAIWLDKLSDFALSRFFDISIGELIEEYAGIPSLFSPLYGDLAGDDCCHCGQPLNPGPEWGNGFLAVDLGDNYELLPGGGFGPGVFCLDCVKRMKAWRDVCWIVLGYRRELEGNDA